MSKWNPRDEMELGRDYFHCTVCDKDRSNEEMASDEDVCKECFSNRPDDDELRHPDDRG
jgi:hypothetical protein